MCAEFNCSDLQEAFLEGLNHYNSLSDHTINDNPFNINSEWELHCQWREGYYEAAVAD